MQIGTFASSLKKNLGKYARFTVLGNTYLTPGRIQMSSPPLLTDLQGTLYMRRLWLGTLGLQSIVLMIDLKLSFAFNHLETETNPMLNSMHCTHSFFIVWRITVNLRKFVLSLACSTFRVNAPAGSL